MTNTDSVAVLRERIALSLKCNHPETETEYAWAGMLREALAALSAQGERTFEFEVWQDDFVQAAGCAATFDAAVIEAEHYAVMYGQDGPVEVRYYEKREIDAAALAARTGKGEANGR